MEFGGASEFNGIHPYIDQAAVRIRRYFESGTDEALVIGVFGEWGSGKSTVLEAIGQQFPNQSTGPSAKDHSEQTLTVRFNPWRFERETHLLVPLLKTVERVLLDFLAAQSIRVAESEGLLARVRRWWSEPADGLTGREWLVNRTVLVANCAVALTAMLKFKVSGPVPGVGEVEVAPYESLKAVHEQVDRARANLDQVRAASKLESLYYDLHGQLHKVTRGEPGRTERLNFLFLIDDLDRCLPDKAVEMLESIKLFLDVAGCAFVIALDDEVVERGIAHRYRDYLELSDRAAESIAYSLKPERYKEYLSRFSGLRLPPITGHEYLEKVVHLPFRLPRWSPDEVSAFLLQKYPELFGIATRSESAARSPRTVPQATDPPSKRPAPAENWLLRLFLRAVPPIPRKLVRAAELLEFTRGVAAARGLERIQQYTLVHVVLLQLFAPQCFRFLRRNRREAWLTLERRIFSARAGREGRGFLDGSFFDWWENECKRELSQDPTARSYIERIEQPFIAELRQAVNTRTGFDPRDLFSTDLHLELDRDLAPYFSLFMSPIPEVERSTGTRFEVVRPREPERFVDQLMSAQPEAWLNVISAETALRGRVLDAQTFALLVSRVRERPEQVSEAWLQVVLEILNSDQVKLLYRESAILDRLASERLDDESNRTQN